MKKHNMTNFETNTSATRNDIETSAVGGFFPPQISQFVPPRPPPPHDQPPSASKKRSLPGNPDPDAEVIALSPTSLQATNRFLCEICNKGFQRDQNLQLHRRGHNLPWKLKQRSKGEVVRKKVYVCPEPSCVHHHPSRALGDLTGIKKHFFRKHGEKKWKCGKCTKRYAVQSDWKAHAKVCGTREYKCDCGTIFSRRDSFITHRAFCDALAQETYSTTTLLNHQLHQQSHHLGGLSIKRELQDQEQQHLFNPTQSAQLGFFFSGGLDPTFPNHQTRSHSPLFDGYASNIPSHMSDTMGPAMSQPITHHGSSGLITFPFASEEATTMSMQGGGNGFFDHGNGHHIPRDPMAMMNSTSMCYASTGPGLLAGLSYLNDSFDHEGLVGVMMNNTPNIHNNEETATKTSRGMKPVESQQLSAKRKNTTRDFLGLKDASGFDLMRKSFTSSSSSSDPVMSNNGGQQVLKDNNNDHHQYTYFGRVE